MHLPNGNVEACLEDSDVSFLVYINNMDQLQRAGLIDENDKSKALKRYNEITEKIKTKMSGDQ